MQTALYREVIPAFQLTEAEIKAKIEQDIPRRAEMLKRRKVLMDNWKQDFQTHLARMFHPETYTDMLGYVDVSNNLAKRVTNELSLVYKESIERTITPKASNKRYQEITGSLNLDKKMARANFLMNGLNDLIIMTVVLGNRLDLQLLTPDKVTVFENEDDPAQIDALVIEDKYMNHRGEEETRFFFWSPTRHFILDNKYRILRVPGNEALENPYASLNVVGDEVNFFPFTFAHKSDRENSFWDNYSGNDLFEGNTLVALFNTFKAMMIPMQFKQLAVQKPLDDNQTPKNNQLKNPQHIFQSNGQIQVLDWQSQLAQLDEAIDKKIFQIAGNYGISAENFKLSAVATSGFARMISKERLLEIRREQVKTYRDLEHDLFTCIRAANNLFELGQPIQETATMKIDFPEPTFALSPEEELNALEKQIELGVTNILEYIRSKNPDIETDAEAEEYLNKNIEIRDRVNSRFGGLVNSFLRQRQITTGEDK